MHLRGDRRIRLACRHCGSLRLDPKIGRYGPYGHCRDCGKNTSVQPTCRGCGVKIRVEREGFGFAGRCDECGTVTSIVVGGSPLDEPEHPRPARGARWLETALADGSGLGISDSASAGG